MYSLITGSSRGLGRSLALRLYSSGHRIAIHFKEKREEAYEVAALLKGASVFQADLRQKSDIEEMMSEINERWGRLDVLINNAAVTVESLCLKTSDEVLDRILDTNLTAAMMLSRAAVPLMKQRGGHIINISSLAGLKGKKGLGAYAASKAGLVGLSISLARELACYNIRVNTVLPGYLMTDMGRSASLKAREIVCKDSILGRCADIDEVSDFINYLIQTRGITGQVFNLDSRIM
jgi:3-oxoacyl-[acyl-carrier protein] reductase